MASNNLRLQGVWIEVDETDFNVSTLAYPGQLGAYFQRNGKTFQIVQFKATTTTIANGTPVMWSDYDDFVVSAEIDDSKRNHIAGVAVDGITAGNYGCIQVAGPHSAVLTDGLVAQNGYAIFMSATDGTATTIIAGTATTYQILGYATATSVAVSTSVTGTTAVNIRVPLNTA